MAARYPEKFKCGILLNPVVNIPFTVNASGKKNNYFRFISSKIDYLSCVNIKQIITKI